MNKTMSVALWLLTSPSVFAATTAVYSQQAPEPIGIYSQAIKAGETVYISGQIPIDPKTGEMVQGDFKQQLRRVLKTINHLAKASGGDIKQIVKITVYVTDLQNFAAVNEIMAEFFKKPYPARAVIEVKALPKNASVEIEAVMSL